MEARLNRGVCNFYCRASRSFMGSGTELVVGYNLGGPLELGAAIVAIMRPTKHWVRILTKARRLLATRNREAEESRWTDGVELRLVWSSSGCIGVSVQGGPTLYLSPEDLDTIEGVANALGETGGSTPPTPAALPLGDDRVIVGAV